jgi:hypothetical protein
MTTKTHLARQEELVPEVGIQIRADDPVSPSTEQVWLNTFENRLKARVGNVIRVFYENMDTGSLEIPPSGILDGNKSYSYYKTLTGEASFTYENLFDGVSVKMMLTNNQTNTNRVINVSLPPSSVMTVGNYWTINSAANINKYYVWYDFNGTGANQPVLFGITPLRVIMTPGRKEKTQIKVKAFTSPIFSPAEYFKIYNSSNTEYYIWFNTDGYGGNPSDKPELLLTSTNGIQVNVLSTNTATQIASITASAINSSGYGFVSSSIGDKITIENVSIGTATDLFVSNLPVPNIIVPGADTLVLVQGAPADTASDIASLTAAVLQATTKFTVTVNSGIMTITYTGAGESQAVQNIDIPSGFTASITTAGSGPININLPIDTKFEESLASTALVVPAQKIRIYELIKLSTQTISVFKDYNI